ncbi:hypothetical protein WJX74_000168 [Apatococcus lobatus]|uniref:Uncharacterized protein n=1 Tax=Apatococcus lobatus TaxID=904363 RepID=A0AAW1RDE6_9CHLO
MDEAAETVAWSGAYDENGLPHGKGKLVYPSRAASDEEDRPKDQYEGELQAGVRQGSGIYTWANNASYTGRYERNVREGKGVMQFPGGARYEGEWQANKMHGEGVYTYANGDQYQGTFNENRKHGLGAYWSQESQTSSIGEWKAGEFVKGDCAMKDGFKWTGTKGAKGYQGTFVNMRCGTAQAGSFGTDRWNSSGPLQTSI